MTDKPINPSGPDALEVVPLNRPPRAVINVPGSKSITNRALVLAALSAKGFAFGLRNALQSEDTEVMVECLRALGFRVLTDWPQSVICVSSGADELTIPARGAELFVGNSGTTVRFLTAMVSLGQGWYRLDGVPRMRERPIADLLAALEQLGVTAYSEQHNGCPPVLVGADGLNGGTVLVKGDVSSQFLSGLLLAAPYARGPVVINVDGPLVSWPYVDMTLRMLEQWGFLVLTDRALPRFEVFNYGRQRDQIYRQQEAAAAFHEGYDPRRHLWLREYYVEPDASAAGYFWGAAAITGGEITVPGFDGRSLQGDVRLVDVLKDMGCEVARGKQGVTVRGGPLHGVDVDMNDISDCVMTLAAVALFADGPTTIRNVAHIRHKETDRLRALATELRRLGAGVEEHADGLTITPGPRRGTTVETYNDHRMAMSLTLVGLRVPGVVIRNPGCVAKTYPRFFEDLERLQTLV